MMEEMKHLEEDEEKTQQAVNKVMRRKFKVSVVENN